MKLHIKSFTLLEMVVVVWIIWILMLWMTIYLDWTGERTKVIEAEWCINSFWWILNNYLYYTLTSKNIKVWEEDIPPKYYTIMLSWDSNKSCNSTGSLCDKILLWYITGDNSVAYNNIYQTYSIWNTCNQSKIKLWFYRWSWDNNNNNNDNYISMNKWFLPLNNNDLPFKIKVGNDNQLLWYIIIILCIDKNCTSQKQIWRWRVDARSQTIPYEKCRFYDENQLNMCKTREGCTVYSGSDPTVCMSY